MKYSKFVKSGNKVFCTRFKEPVTVDEILDISNEETPTKKEIDDYPQLINVHVIDEDGGTYCVDATDLQPLRHVEDLSFDELKELRKQITLGSMFYHHYCNTLGVDCHEACFYADGFGQASGWREELDTPENFALYCTGDFCIDDYPVAV